MERIWQLLAKKMSNGLSPEETNELDQLTAAGGGPPGELLPGIHGLEVAGNDEAAKERSLVAIKARLDDTAAADTPVVRLRAHRWRWPAAAAVALILLTAGAWWLQPRRQDSKPVVAYNEVSTIGGKKQQLDLPDGTHIIVNIESRLRYNKDFGKQARDIYLDGEAYFEAGKNAEIPLVVHTSKADVMVTGTIFNVKAYRGDAIMEASLIAGGISLLPYAAPDKKIVLRPGEKFTMGDEKEIPPRPVKLYEAAITGHELIQVTKIKKLPADTLVAENSWIADKMVFDAASFSQVARQMERWYNVRIEINDATLSAMPLSGNFEKESLKQALDALREITPFSYTIRNNEVIIGR
jgi:ferric-dicitrate binding protein FerR (iron transport regulator)